MPKKKYSPSQSSFFEDLGHIESVRDIRQREAVLRTTVVIRSEKPTKHNFPSLVFPPRYELLKAETEKRKIPLRPLIMPVQDAIIEIDKEKRQVEETGMGKLFIISGASGSGKTTFLNSLNLFVDGIGAVHNITMRAIDRSEAVEDKLAAIKREDADFSIVVLEGKEVPGALRSDEIDILLTTLNADFRREPGRRTIFVMPTTSHIVAQAISQRAIDIGGMTSRSRPFYVFTGPQRNEYKTITDTMLRALNDARGLQDYGVTDEVAKGIAESSESIGTFMSGCYEEIKRQQDRLKGEAVAIQRKNVHLWMVFCSLEDDNRRNHDMIRSLTSSNHQHVQVGRLLTGDANETRFWEGKEQAFALAAQYLDLRIMYLPLRTANAIVTAYGGRELIEKLRNVETEDGIAAMKREAVRSAAQESLGGTSIGAFLRREEFVEKDISRRNRPTEKHRLLFQEFMKQSNDKDLNAMVAAALRDLLIKRPEHKIATELSIDGVGHLIADIAVVTPTDIYCLEFKWRSSLLAESEIIRETADRVKGFAVNLPELRNLLGVLE
jgi:hypothetical protein